MWSGSSGNRIPVFLDIIVNDTYGSDLDSIFHRPLGGRLSCLIVIRTAIGQNQHYLPWLWSLKQQSTSRPNSRICWSAVERMMVEVFGFWLYTKVDKYVDFRLIFRLPTKFHGTGSNRFKTEQSGVVIAL